MATGIVTAFRHSLNRRIMGMLMVGLLLTSLRLDTWTAWGQVLGPQIPAEQAQMDTQLRLIHLAEQEHHPAAEQGALWAHLATKYHSAGDFLKAENAYNHSLHLLKSVPSVKADYAATLENLAALYLIFGRVEEAESVRKKALAVREELGMSAEIGVNEVHLADFALARHQFKKAEQLGLKGLREMASSPNPPSVAMLSALITITYARCLRKHCGDGLISAREAIAIATIHFRPESAAVAFALETLGFAEWKNGAVPDGGKDMLHAIRILRTKLTPGDPRLATILLQYRDYLIDSNRRVEAQEMQDEVDRIKSRTRGPCSACTVSVYSLSNTLR